MGKLFARNDGNYSLHCRRVNGDRSVCSERDIYRIGDLQTVHAQRLEIRLQTGRECTTTVIPLLVHAV